MTFENLEEGLSKTIDGRTFTLMRRDCVYWVRVSKRASWETVTLVGIDAQGRERALPAGVPKDGDCRAARATIEGRVGRMSVPFEIRDLPLR